MPSRFRHLHRLPLRDARSDLESIGVLDPHTEQSVPILYPMDKQGNAEHGRRAIAPVDDSAPVDALPAYANTRTGMAPFLEYASLDDLLVCLEHLCPSAGNPGLFSEPLAHALVDHALGNYRVLTNMAAEILPLATRHELTQLDENLFFDVFPAKRKP